VGTQSSAESGVLMSRLSKLGTHVRVPDGRVGTVVFNGLTGIGIKWGLHDPPAKYFEGTSGDIGNQCPTPLWEWFPDAMLRSPKMSDILGMPCVCEEYEVEII